MWVKASDTRCTLDITSRFLTDSFIYYRRWSLSEAMHHGISTVTDNCTGKVYGRGAVRHGVDPAWSWTKALNTVYVRLSPHVASRSLHKRCVSRKAQYQYVPNAPWCLNRRSQYSGYHTCAPFCSPLKGADLLESDWSSYRTKSILRNFIGSLWQLRQQPLACK